MRRIAIGTKGREAAGTREAKPYRWALSPWALTFRRLTRRWIIQRHARRFCSPLSIEGEENFARIGLPSLVIANHTSHFDTVIALSVLPDWLYNRTAVAAAADRFYRRRLQGMWFSLRYNSFPIARGGGKAALDYSEQLLGQGWSVLIFPEGTRSRTGDLLPFHPGPAILALRRQVPVLPICIEGAGNILKPGTRWARPAPVRVRIGQPLALQPGSDAMEATATLEAAMRELAAPREERLETAGVLV